MENLLVAIATQPKIGRATLECSIKTLCFGGFVLNNTLVRHSLTYTFIQSQLLITISATLRTLRETFFFFAK